MGCQMHCVYTLSSSTTRSVYIRERKEPRARMRGSGIARVDISVHNYVRTA